MGCLLNPLIILLAVIGLVAAVILLGLAAVASSLAALSSSLTVLASQCVLGVLALGGFATAGLLVALNKPIVQTLLRARFNLPNAAPPTPVSPQAWLPSPGSGYPALPESAAEEFYEPVTIVRQPVTRVTSVRVRTIDARTLRKWGFPIDFK